MNIEGYAFKKNEEELMAQYNARYKEIAHLVKTIKMSRNPAYGKCNFSGTLETEAEKLLTPLDICLIADRGNLCFGGECTISDNRFTGCYWTD